MLEELDEGLGCKGTRGCLDKITLEDEGEGVGGLMVFDVEGDSVDDLEIGFGAIDEDLHNCFCVGESKDPKKLIWNESMEGVYTRHRYWLTCLHGQARVDSMTCTRICKFLVHQGKHLKYLFSKTLPRWKCWHP